MTAPSIDDDKDCRPQPHPMLLAMMTAPAPALSDDEMSFVTECTTQLLTVEAAKVELEIELLSLRSGYQVVIQAPFLCSLTRVLQDQNAALEEHAGIKWEFEQLQYRLRDADALHESLDSMAEERVQQQR